MPCKAVMNSRGSILTKSNLDDEAACYKSRYLNIIRNKAPLDVGFVTFLALLDGDLSSTQSFCVNLMRGLRLLNSLQLTSYYSIR